MAKSMKKRKLPLRLIIHVIFSCVYFTNCVSQSPTPLDLKSETTTKSPPSSRPEGNVSSSSHVLSQTTPTSFSAATFTDDSGASPSQNPDLTSPQYTSGPLSTNPPNAPPVDDPNLSSSADNPDTSLSSDALITSPGTVELHMGEPEYTDYPSVTPPCDNSSAPLDPNNTMCSPSIHPHDQDQDLYLNTFDNADSYSDYSNAEFDYSSSNFDYNPVNMDDAYYYHSFSDDISYTNSEGWGDTEDWDDTEGWDDTESEIDYTFYNDYSEDYLSSAFFGAPRKTREFIWNKTIPAKDYQQSYCHERCDDGKVKDLHFNYFFCFTMECTSCTCERPACEVYGICCPDISEPYFSLPGTPVSNDKTDTKSSGGDDSSNATQETEEDTYEKAGNDSTTGSDVSFTLSSHLVPTVTVDPITPSDVKSMVKDSYVPKTYCEASGSDITTFLYVRSCPPHFNDTTVVDMCIGGGHTDNNSNRDIGRVFDKATRVNYYNYYCAVCNQASEIMAWQPTMICTHYMHLYQATNEQQLLQLGLKKGSQCVLKYVHPLDKQPYFMCVEDFSREDVINTCNVTGLWRRHDPDVKRACEGDELAKRVHRIHSRVRDVPPYYKNIFCAICNMGAYPQTKPCDEEGTQNDDNDILKSPFSLLLGFRRKEVDFQQDVYKSILTFSTCAENEWPSPDGGCLPLHCVPGKTMKGENCSTALDYIRGLGYHLRLWLVPTSSEGYLIHEQLQKADMDTILVSINNQMSYLINTLTSQYKFNTSLLNGSFAPPEGVAETKFKAEESYTPALHYWLDGSFRAEDNSSRDVFERSVTDIFLHNIEVNVTGEVKITFRPQITTDDIGSSDYCAEKNLSAIEISCEKTKMEKNAVSQLSLRFFRDEDIFLNVTNVLNCRYVSFNNTQYDMETDRTVIPPHTTVRIDLNVTVVNISDHKDLNMLTVDPDGHLLVCHTLLDEKLTEIEEDRKRRYTAKLSSTSSSDDSSKGQYILTLVCMGASMLCLLLTLVTYFRFSVLRSVAGRNNIFLCGSLLLAQASLLASSHVEGPEALCAAIGISTHFLWLCMFCWSFICCFHMFRVFTAKTRSSQAKSNADMMILSRNVALSLLFPSLVVVAVVLSSYFTSHGRQIGYGDDACYLDSALLVGVSTVVPLALVILCNLIFFITTVVKIHNVRKLQQTTFKKEDKRDLYIYIKLSTMTGAFWTIFIVAEAVDVDALRYIAIILNGLQGVFIFMSYICNKRVVNLYRSSFGLAPLSTSSIERNSSSRKRSTLGRLASLVRRDTMDSKIGSKDLADPAEENGNFSGSVTQPE